MTNIIKIESKLSFDLILRFQASNPRSHGHKSDALTDWAKSSASKTGLLLAGKLSSIFILENLQQESNHRPLGYDANIFPLGHLDLFCGVSQGWHQYHQVLATKGTGMAFSALGAGGGMIEGGEVTRGWFSGEVRRRDNDGVSNCCVACDQLSYLSYLAQDLIRCSGNEVCRREILKYRS